MGPSLSLDLLLHLSCYLYSSCLADALRRTSGPLPPQIQQMLLVLQTVHKSTPTEEFFALQKLVGQVVDNYFPMITRTKSMAEKRLPLNGQWIFCVGEV